MFEKRLIEQYIRENGTDPVNGEDLSAEDLMELKQPRVVRPRPPTQTSIPALLATFQNEWDAVILESYQLKQQLAETRQELSTALYYNDSAEKVIARLQKERDEARDALSRITISSSSNGVNGDAMQVDGQSLPDSVVARIEQTQQQYVGICCYLVKRLTNSVPQTVRNTTGSRSSTRMGDLGRSSDIRHESNLRSDCTWKSITGY